MAEVFGFDESAQEMEDYVSKALEGQQEMYAVADDMANLAESNASGQGLQVTGAGVAGIQTSKQGDAVEVGWAGRPNLHLYFHEIGTYKDPMRPHIRPAFEALEQEFQRRVQSKITD